MWLAHCIPLYPTLGFICLNVLWPRPSSHTILYAPQYMACRFHCVYWIQVYCRHPSVKSLGHHELSSFKLHSGPLSTTLARSLTETLAAMHSLNQKTRRDDGIGPLPNTMPRLCPSHRRACRLTPTMSPTLNLLTLNLHFDVSKA